MAGTLSGGRLSGSSRFSADGQCPHVEPSTQLRALNDACSFQVDLSSIAHFALAKSRRAILSPDLSRRRPPIYDTYGSIRPVLANWTRSATDAPRAASNMDPFADCLFARCSLRRRGLLGIHQAVRHHPSSEIYFQLMQFPRNLESAKQRPLVQWPNGRKSWVQARAWSSL